MERKIDDIAFGFQAVAASCAKWPRRPRSMQGTRADRPYTVSFVSSLPLLPYFDLQRS